MNTDRYIRQTLLDAIGEEGQQKLLNAHVVIVGCGGLGSIAAPYLAGAGIGTLTLVDGDRPHISNLHRQVFFGTTDTEWTKSEYLARHLKELNPEIVLKVHPKMITKTGMNECFEKADLVLECTDNIQVKYMVNDFCALKKIPMVYGAIHKYDGYVSCFENKDDSDIHLRDVFAVPNDDIPSCSEVGVMGALAGMIGLMQANEAIKYISGAGKTLSGILLTYNILSNDQLKLRLKKTFTSDLQKVFDENSYIAEQVCETYEVTINEVLNRRDDFRLISILEDGEHEDIDEAVERQPLSDFNPANWRGSDSNPAVFYCMSGVRSATLVNQLLAQNPSDEVLSLAGGLKAFKKLQS